MKKVLFIAMCTALVASCASKRAAFVDSAITEARTLKELAKAGNVAVPAAADSIITAAEKEQQERQTEKAFVLADNAILQLQMSLLKQEQTILSTLKIGAENDLATSKESLNVYHNVLQERKGTPKEQVIN
ncbi:hypothetical protein R83H12_01110 [Fibrobacteria bacterium R8-3-H12]